MTTCTENGVSYTQTWDEENRLKTVTVDGKTTTFYYDGDGQRVKLVLSGVEGKVAYENLAEGIVATSNATLTGPVLSPTATCLLTSRQADSGSGSSGEYAYTTQTGLQYVQIDLGAAYSVDKIKVWHYAADGRIYNATRTQVSADGTNWTTVFDSAVSGTYPETAAGKTHAFVATNVRYVRDWLNGSTANGGNHWVEIEVWGRVTTNARTTCYVNAFYEEEWTGSTKTNTFKHYYAGGQRIATRDNEGLKFNHTDHLGSASRISDASGNPVRSLWYDPWGAVAIDSGGQSVRYKYTGQEQDNTWFYDYHARLYDPALGRFISADTIVPQPGNPQSLNRYAYVLNNPLKYTDPTGHFTEDAIRAYLQGLYSDAWEQYWNTWQADKGWWALLGAAGEGDTLYRYGFDSAGNPTVDSYRFAGKGKEVLSGIYQGKGENRQTYNLCHVYANKGAGIVGVHINKNISVELLGATDNLTVWFHRVTWAEDRMVDGVRSLVGTVIGGVIGGPRGAVAGFLLSTFSDDLGGNYPGTVEDDYVLRVYMGSRQGRLLKSFAVDLNWRFSRLDLTYVQNGFGVQTWEAYDNGRRW